MTAIWGALKVFGAVLLVLWAAVLGACILAVLVAAVKRRLRRGRGLREPGPLHPDRDVVLTLEQRHTLAGIEDATKHRAAQDRLYGDGKRQP